MVLTEEFENTEKEKDGGKISPLFYFQTPRCLSLCGSLPRCLPSVSSFRVCIRSSTAKRRSLSPLGSGLMCWIAEVCRSHTAPVLGLDFKRTGNFSFLKLWKPAAMEKVYVETPCCMEAQASDVEKPHRGEPRCLASEESLLETSSLAWPPAQCSWISNLSQCHMEQKTTELGSVYPQNHKK